MIPEDKREAVSRGLREAFGVDEYEDIRMVSEGAFSKVLVYRIVVGGSAYLLRVIPRKDHPGRHYANMRAAAEAGIAPRVWYTNADDKVSITDFIDAVPFTREAALRRLPRALRITHALPPFEGVPHYINTTSMFLIHEGPARDGFLQGFRAAHGLPPEQAEELLAWYAEVTAAYPHDDGEFVSSHNDVKPENVMFDGQQMWMVDWEAAFYNDRYNDLAVGANFVADDEAQERIYLEEYFGRPAGEYELARFAYMQQLVHLFYAMGYLYLGGSGQPVDMSESLPEFAAFHRRLWAGEVPLVEKPAKVLYARVHLAKLLHNARQTRYADALRIVSARRVSGR